MKHVLKREIKDNRIILYITGFNSKALIADFIRILLESEKLKINEVTIDFSEYKNRTFPNVILPIKGIISYYESEKNYKFNFVELNYSRLIQTGFPNHHTVGSDLILLEQDIFDKIISFKTSEELNAIIELVFEQFKEKFAFPPGVLQGANWGLSEVMDNVIQHSISRSSYVMVQVHNKRQTLVFTVYDNGQGIYNSLKKSEQHKNKIKSHLGAIKLSINKNITRNPAIGAGFGLWGLRRIILENKGILRITSGKASLIIDKEKEITQENLLFFSDKSLTTLIEIELRYDNYINLKNVFGDYETYDYVTRVAEKYENETSNFLEFYLSNEKGVRTRTDGEITRNRIINLQNINNKPIKIIFDQVTEKVTSSYIDEVIAKLYEIYGAVKFDKSIKLVGTDDYVNLLIRKAIEVRTLKSLSKLLTF